MTGARYDRSGTRLRMLCTRARDSGFENYWKNMCDWNKTGLNQPLSGRRGPVESCFLIFLQLFKRYRLVGSENIPCFQMEKLDIDSSCELE